MRKLIYLTVIALLLSVPTAIKVQADNQTKQIKLSLTSDKPLLDYVNEVRAKNHVPALASDSSLFKTAQMKAEDMATLNYWDHTRPNGEPFSVLIFRERPGSKLIGENLGECFTSNQALVDAWVASEGHLRNMIDPKFTLFGSYTLWDADQHCFISVNHFGN